MDVRERRDPFGNALPRRLHWSDGSYYHVIQRNRRSRWTRVGRAYAEALRE